MDIHFNKVGHRNSKVGHRNNKVGVYETTKWGSVPVSNLAIMRRNREESDGRRRQPGH